MQTAKSQEEEMDAARARLIDDGLPPDWDIRSQASQLSEAINSKLEKIRRKATLEATQAAEKAAEFAELQERFEAGKIGQRQLLAAASGKLTADLQRDIETTSALVQSKKETTDSKKQIQEAKIRELQAKTAALKLKQSVLAIELARKQQAQEAELAKLTEKNMTLRQFNESSVPTLAQIAAKLAENENRISRLYKHSHTITVSGWDAFKQSCGKPIY